MNLDTITTPVGRRPMTLDMLAGQMSGRSLSPNTKADKWKLFRALTVARARFGLKDKALALMNALLSFYAHKELSAKGGLIVFPSNVQLSLRSNGMSEATMRRHLNVLVNAGLISRKDSANGKRYAWRDVEGNVDEAFGFSLAPLLASASEIEQAAAEVVAERVQKKRLQERLTIVRRDVSKLVDTAKEEKALTNSMAFSDRYRAILDALPRKRTVEQLQVAVDAMASLRDEIVKLLENLYLSRNPSGNAGQAERLHQNSNTESQFEFETGSENEQGEKPAPEFKPRHEPMKAFPLGMVLRACPDIIDYSPGGRIENWRDLMTAAVVVRSMLGVSPSAYQRACEVMGSENAAVVMACILERAEHICTAGGYLRDLTGKAEHGAFSLGPMLMALLKARGETSLKVG